tara:strand:+ start:502 stop:1029 length:528 start_codon:yes stop_codon:yes gene_type:complete
MPDYLISKNVFLIEGQWDNLSVIEKLKNKVKEYTQSNPLEADHSIKNGVMTQWDCFVQDEDFHLFLKDNAKYFLDLNLIKFNVFDAWGGLYKKGSQAYCEKHDHLGANLCCGILYLSDQGPGTYFPELNKTIKEKKGGFVLFHPILEHEVQKYTYLEDRQIIAFNIRKLRKEEHY